MAIEHVIVSGSPRSNGKCVQIAMALADAIHNAYPDDGVSFVAGHEMRVNPCLGCDGCKAEGACVIEDDMDAIREVLDQASNVIVVSPVYFAGPPAQLKAMLDRLQPYFYHPAPLPKRQLSLVVVGDGGDPHGYEPLVTCVRSAFANAGFQLDSIVPAIGLNVEAAAQAAIDSIVGPVDSAGE